MKYIEEDKIDQIPGKRLLDNQDFAFECHSDLTCFNKCCRNLNLFLYPYDVVRLRSALGISSDDFLDTHVDLVLRPAGFFPDVLLRMAENEQKTCPFLSPGGCSVYNDRPGSCRMFPVESGLLFDETTRKNSDLYFFRPPEFCLGRHESRRWSSQSWMKNQNALPYYRMDTRWAELKRRFQTDPWGIEGPNGQKGKMAFMATYNVDKFRDFLFQSSFLKRYKVPRNVLKNIRKSDRELLLLSFAWVKNYLWGIPSKKVILR